MGSSNNNDYRVYKYFKKHPGTVISLFSIIGLGVGYIVNLFMCLKVYKYLSYWGISDVSIIEFNITYKYFFIVISFLSLGILFIHKHISDIFYNYLTQTKVVYNMKILEKLSKKEVKEMGKGISKIKLNILAKVINHKKLKSSIAALKEKEKEIDVVFKKLKFTRKKLKKLIFKAVRFPILISVAIMLVLVYFSSYIMLGDVEWINLVVSAIVFTLLLVFFTVFPEYLAIRKKFMRELKSKSMEELEIDLNSWCDAASAVEINLKQISNLDIKEVMRDSSIKRFLVQGVIALTTIFLMFSCGVMYDIYHCKEFKIVYKSDTPYVIIYENSGYCYLEEAKIDDQNIEIYTDKQRILAKEDLVYEIKSFEKVNKYK